MPEIIEFPANLTITDRTDPQLGFNTRSPGVAIDGSEQVISPLSELWRYRVIIPIITKDQARSLRVIKSALKGRFNYLLLRLCDQYRISRKDIGLPPDGTVMHSDGSTFSDGSGYRLAEPSPPLVEDAAENAVTITVRASDFEGYMTSGVFFSIDYWLYQVDDWELDGANYILQISPPLRGAVAAGTEADFSALSIWRLDADASGNLDLNIGKFGFAELALVEPVGRE